MTPLAKYEAFFGRPADFVLDPISDAVPPIRVARFPAVSAGFFRRIFTPVHDRFVYITDGMSSTPMHVSENQVDIYPSRIELIAFCEGAYMVRDTDVVSLSLRALAHIPFNEDMFFGPTHTAALPEPLGKDSEMNAFFFALPDGVEMKRLCSCTVGAQLVLSALPISASERDFAVRNGPAAFIQLLEQHRVPNLFDPYRKPII